MFNRPFTFLCVHALALTAVTSALANNLNPEGSLCLDIRDAGGDSGAFPCANNNSECPDQMQCIDSDDNPLNGGMCMPRACYAPGEEILVDLELGPTDEPVCGAQAFLEWDTATLELISIDIDPDGEFGGWVGVLAPTVDEEAGTIDLSAAVPAGVVCDEVTGRTSGGTVARLTFIGIWECDSFGVRFREHNPPTRVSGAQGVIETSGCNGEPLPSGTDDMAINHCLSGCADGDGNGIRDDNCVIYANNNCICTPVLTAFGDVGSPFGDCMPDGVTDIHDRFHFLNCFADIDSQGNSGYPCEPSSPNTYNVDAGGPFAGCQPDGVCDINDVVHVNNKFAGTSACFCPFGGPAPTPPAMREDQQRVAVALSSMQQSITAGGTIEVEATLAGTLASLRGYQLHLEAAGGKRGALELIDIRIDARPDHALGGVFDYQAFNLATGQMLAGFDQDDHAPTSDAYLATFVFKASRNAEGRFTIDVLHDATNSAHRTFLIPANRDGHAVVDDSQSVAINVLGSQRRAKRSR